MDDTIYALSTPAGNGVAVIRISGAEAQEALQACFSYSGQYESHRLYYGKIVDGLREIDEAMAVLMVGPRSYTGEDCAELHCHGSNAVLRSVLNLLAKLGYRQAEPGEFTKRAFLNGRLDLSQAEAVMDLIHASYDRSAKIALEQLQGGESKQIIQLQDKLTDAIAALEAGIDYPEEDWEDQITIDIKKTLSDVYSEIEALIQSGRQGRIVREGLRVALVGRPNVGKSTLLNTLLGEERAIVTDIPGTTRDTLEEEITIAGLRIRLVDTAGIHESGDEVEQIGIARARNLMQAADLVLCLLDGSKPCQPEDKKILEEVSHLPIIVVITKVDLSQELMTSELNIDSNIPIVSISAKENNGIQILCDEIEKFFDCLAPDEMPPVIVTNRRHIDALTESINALENALGALETADLDCITIDLRRAWFALGKITGQTVDESIIDRIFSKFCLGK